MILLYGGVSFARSSDFASDVALWGAEHRRDPSNALVLEGLITAASKTQQYELAAKSAIDAIALEPNPKGKAYMAIEWLRAKIDLSRNDQRALSRLRIEAEHLQMGQPTGDFAKVAESIAPEGLEWMRKAPMFTLTRSWLALRTLDFDAAADLAHQAEADKFAHDSAVKVFLFAAIATGKWDTVDEMANSSAAPPNVASIILNRERSGHGAAYLSASLLKSLGELSVARAIEEADMAAHPDGDAVSFLLMLDVEAHSWDAARKLVADQHKPANDEWTRQTLEAIAQAETAASKPGGETADPQR